MLYIMEETAPLWMTELTFSRLPKKEQEFLKKRRNEKAFAEGVLARALLFYGLKKEYHLTEFPEIFREENGKPYLPDFLGIHFNLSHTDGKVLCAISDNPVGADIQKKVVFKENLFLWISHENERKNLGSMTGETVFNSLWCLKEAYLKYTGEGIRCPMKNLDFSRVLRGETDQYEGAFVRFAKGRDYTYAVVQTSPPERPVYLEIKELEEIL